LAIVIRPDGKGRHGLLQRSSVVDPLA